MPESKEPSPTGSGDGSLIYIHGLAPPTPGGVSVVVHMLLSRSDDRIDVFTDARLRRRTRPDALVLPATYHWMARFPRWARRRVRAVAAVQSALNVLLATVCGLRAAVVARRRRSPLVLAVVDEGFSLVAGYVCSKASGLPLVVWAFDPWEENAYNGAERWLAQRLEARIWHHASRVIVHSPEMTAHYAAKHGVECEVLPTPVDLNGSPEQVERRAVSGEPVEVLMAGALYWLQIDAVQRLGRVLRGMPNVRLTVLSTPELMRAKGIEADRIEDWLPPARLPSRLAQADVLFLGLSFDTVAPLAVHTSAPARLPQYMASGTPILIHAPAGSHVAEYARREDFASVVDEPDEERLASALAEILADPELAERRARRAAQLAADHHSAGRVAKAFEQVLLQARGK